MKLQHPVYNMIQQRCTVADRDNTQARSFILSLQPAQRGGEEGNVSVVCCVTRVLLVVKQLGNRLVAIHSYRKTLTQRKSNHLNVTVSH